MKTNISFLQLVLGVSGALLIYSGVKDLDVQRFLHTLVTDPSQAFQSGYFHSAKKISTPTQPAQGNTGNPSQPI